MRRLPLIPFLLSLIAAAATAHGESAVRLSVDVSLSLIPTKVSGTLSPLVVAVDGKTVVALPVAAKSLQLNGVAIHPKTGKGSPFFVQTESDVLTITAHDSTGRPLAIPRLELPRLRVGQVTSSGAFLIQEGGTKETLFDGAQSAAENRQIYVAFENDPKWRARPHVIELKMGPVAPGRVYELKVHARTLAAAPAPSEELSWELLAFRASFLASLQSVGGQSFSIEPSWNPSLSFGKFFVRGNLGASPLRDIVNGRLSIALEYEVLAGADLPASLFVEAGGGAQSWIAYGGTDAALSVNAGVRVPEGFGAKALDRAFIGYSRIFSPLATYQIKVGVGLEF